MASADADQLDFRLVQLKGGNAALSGSEIGRLKKASAGATLKWLVAAYDGDTLRLLPEDLAERKRKRKAK